MKKSIRSVMLFTLLTLGACVTINIYFPAAAAEKAADRIIQDVLGATGGSAPTSQLPTESPEPSADEPQTQSALSSLFEVLLPAAYAQANLDISTPAITKIRNSMKARHPALAPHYASGAIGFTNRALISERDAAKIPLKDRNKVKQLIGAENNDRNALYREIATANGHPEWETNIRDTFASRWVANAKSGWWYQDDKGVWKQR